MARGGGGNRLRAMMHIQALAEPSREAQVDCRATPTIDK